MRWEDYIVADPEVMTGKPVVKGTRLTVDFVLDLMAGGTSEAEIVRNYPRLTVDAIHACLAYASEAVQLARDMPIRAHAQAFERETGIRQHDLFGKYWKSWGDAVREAGLKPNALNSRISDDELPKRYAELRESSGGRL